MFYTSLLYYKDRVTHKLYTILSMRLIHFAAKTEHCCIVIESDKEKI